MPGLWPLLLQPYGMAPGCKNNGDIQPQNTGFDLCTYIPISPAVISTATIRAKDVFIEMHANLVFRAGG